jgi:HK97 family phage prohead protease
MKKNTEEIKVLKYYHGEVKSFDEEKKTAKVVISTIAEDRDGDIVEPSAFKKGMKDYKRHAVLLSSHRQDTLTRQIGEAKSLKVSDDGVEGEYEWYVGKGNQEADWGFMLITRNIAAFSIGFVGKNYEMIESKDKNGNKYISGRRFTEIELYEVSQVLVPSNRGALQANRAAGELCELALKSFNDEDLKPWEGKTAAPEQTDKGVEHEEEGEEQEIDLKSIIETLKKMSKEEQDEVLKLLGGKRFEPSAPETEKPKKHYTDDLFGKGDHAPKPMPAKEESISDRNEKRKQALKEALSETVGNGGTK